MVMDHLSDAVWGHVAFAIMGGVIGLMIGLALGERRWFSRA